MRVSNLMPDVMQDSELGIVSAIRPSSITFQEDVNYPPSGRDHQSPRLQVVDLATDRDTLSAFWDGTAPVPDPPNGTTPGLVHRIVNSPAMDAFEAYRETVGLDEESIEKLERLREPYNQRRTVEDLDRTFLKRPQASEPALVRYDFSGYPIT